MNRLYELEKSFMKKDVTPFRPGDTIKVMVKIREGDKTRLQAFEGICIAKKGSSVRETFTVRRVSYGEGVERVFQAHSPSVDSVEVIKRGKVKRAKLYYLKKKIGKSTKIEEARGVENKKDAPVGEKSVS
ncbi:MAG: 50S ribosomal protein L19 [Candidatus Omnitrophica bacterium]|nr:50S ribosomal protein L19 [Candidatus Omnitrophota bacterium]